MAKKKQLEEKIDFYPAEPSDLLNTFEIEKHILGTILTDSGALSQVSRFLEGYHFSSNVHRSIYEHIRKLDEKNLSIDVPLLIQLLTDEGNLDFVGGKTYIAGLIENTIYPEFLQSYCKTIVDKWILRALAGRAQNVLLEIKEHEIVPEELLSDFTAKIFELSVGHRGEGFQPISKFITSTIDQIQLYRERQGQLVGIGTGFRKLDEYTGGFQQGELVIIAARPSVGKTSFALNIALTAARHYGKRVGFVSLEMSSLQIVLRLLAIRSRISLHKLRTGFLSRDEFNLLKDTSEEIYRIPFFINDRSDQSLNDVRAEIRRMKKEHGIDVVFIDYLGLMRQPGNVESVQVAIANTTRGLKALARELEIPIVVLAQLSRAAVDSDKTDKKPKLHHLRDSGAIEQDADVVLMLYRETYDKHKKYEEMTEEEKQKEMEAEIIIAKQRNGPTGSVEAIFVKEYASFEDVAKGYSSAAEPASTAGYSPRVPPKNTSDVKPSPETKLTTVEESEQEFF
ncbi:MAG: replicative DNA helicase [bacterium]|nr:replicative DNA helicase [bacterium]